jgi:hypothetical protein
LVINRGFRKLKNCLERYAGFINGQRMAFSKRKTSYCLSVSCWPADDVFRTSGGGSSSWFFKQNYDRVMAESEALWRLHRPDIPESEFSFRWIFILCLTDEPFNISEWAQQMENCLAAKEHSPVPWQCC